MSRVTFDLTRVQLAWLLDALRAQARLGCSEENHGEICPCAPCAAREVLPIFEDPGGVTWPNRAEAALQRIADEQYEEAAEILRCEADEYVGFVYGDRDPSKVYGIFGD